jgi:hypothetical protein
MCSGGRPKLNISLPMQGSVRIVRKEYYSTKRQLATLYLRPNTIIHHTLRKEKRLRFLCHAQELARMTLHLPDT